MKKLLLITTIAILLCVIEFVNATDINQAPESEVSLYLIYNTVYGTSYGSNSALNDLQIENDSIWFMTNSQMKMTPIGQWAGYSQKFGYYTDLDTGGDKTELFFHTGGYYDYYSDDNSTPIQRSVSGNFGWYLDNNQDSSPPPWYSDDSLNVVGNTPEHLVTLYGTDNTYLLAWEDLAYNRDNDYNDFVVKAEGTAPVPEPATLLLVVTGVLGIAGIRYGKKRTRQYK